MTQTDRNLPLALPLIEMEAEFLQLTLWLYWGVESNQIYEDPVLGPSPSVVLTAYQVDESDNIVLSQYRHTGLVIDASTGFGTVISL